MNALRRSWAALAAALTLAGCATAGEPAPSAASAASAPAEAPHVRFEFHSGFLMNLHHFLYDAARHPAQLEQAAWAAPPTADERHALDEAAAYYRAHYASHRVPFDHELRAIELALSTHDDAQQSMRGLPLDRPLAAVLEAAAPAYARCLWPRHDGHNQAWIAHARALDARYGAAMQSQLERSLSHPLPTGVRVDVVYDTGDVNGAYTNEDPAQSVLPSTRPDYGGYATLEMLYHEASHVGATDTLEEAIDAEVQAQHRAPDHRLWHAAQFEAVGFAAQTVLQRDGIAYRPYAQANGVFEGNWAPYVPLLDTDWRRHLRGDTTLAQAVHAMVERLPQR